MPQEPQIGIEPMTASLSEAARITEVVVFPQRNHVRASTQPRRIARNLRTKVSPKRPAAFAVGAMIETGEIWLAVYGTGGRYQVSDLGNVRSFCEDGTFRSVPARLCSQGYFRCSISIHGKSERRFLHRLVAEAFIGALPEGMETRHLDGNRENNAASNLRYGTHKENEADRERHGTVLRGEVHGSAKLTAADVAEILRGTDRSPASARRFGVSDRTIRRIRAGHSWKHQQATMATETAAVA